MEPFRYVDRTIPYVTVKQWTDQFHRLRAGMSVKYNYRLNGGEGDRQTVIANRKRLANALGFSFGAWTCAEQVHGKRVVRIGKKVRGAGSWAQETAIAAADGLITDESDILLTAFFADCTPLLFWDPEEGAVGIAHAGWRGTVAGIAREMVERMGEEFGTDSADLHVAIGPSIGPCCYEVDDRVIHALEKVLPSPLEQVVQPKGNSHYFLDLKRANAKILQNVGVPSGRLLVSRYCTCCEDELFHSYRRDKERAGRMVAWIGLMKEREMGRGSQKTYGKL